MRDGLRDGSYVVPRRRLAGQIVRWFGSVTRPAVRPLARSTVRLGGVPGYLPDSSFDDCPWFRGDVSLDGSFGSAAADTAACLTARSAVRFGGVPGSLPDSSLDDCPWFRGDGSLNGSFVLRGDLLDNCFTGEIR
jgi:hypothetical protein